MLWIILVVVIAFFGGVAAGYAVCLVGTWALVHKQEMHLRELINSIEVIKMMDDPLPPEWVVDRLRELLPKEYR